jgi:hypothetical protein
MSENQKPRLCFRMTLGVSTFLMITMLSLGILILVNGSLAPQIPIEASANVVRDIAFLLTVPAVLGILFAVLSRADRRCADDFAFQLLASGALVGMLTMFLFHTFWALDFLPDALGIRGLRGQDMLAAGLLGWACGYFTFRLRGLN